MKIGRDKEGRRVFRFRGRWYRLRGWNIRKYLPKSFMDWILLGCKLAIAAFCGFVLIFWPLFPYIEEAFRG